jgi:hypothetical protein
VLCGTMCRLTWASMMDTKMMCVVMQSHIKPSLAS